MRHKANAQNSSGWKGIGSLLTLRYALILLVAILAIGAAQRLAAAWFIRAASIRSQVETAIGKWTGLQAFTSGSPELSLWPSPKVTVGHVSIYAPGGVRPLMTIAKVSGTFGILSALEGNPAFSTVEIDEPHILVSEDAAGKWNWQSGGKLRDAIANPDEAAQLLSSAHLGAFVIKNGSLEITNGPGRSLSIAGLDGNVDLRSLVGALSFQLSAKVDNRQVSVSGSSSDPLGLIVGRNAPVKMQVSSDLAEGHFEGTGNIGGQPFLSGSISAASGDLPSLCDWLGLRFDAIRR